MEECFVSGLLLREKKAQGVISIILTRLTLNPFSERTRLNGTYGKKFCDGPIIQMVVV